MFKTLKQKRYEKLNALHRAMYDNFDFSKYGRELTDEEACLINGGGWEEQAYKAAHEDAGDTDKTWMPDQQETSNPQKTATGGNNTSDKASNEEGGGTTVNENGSSHSSGNFGPPADQENQNRQKINDEKNVKLYKQRELEIKYGFPYDAPEYGSLCLATSIINLYVKEYAISAEAVDKVMSEAKGKYISSDGTVIDFTSFSKRLAEECNSERYFDYVYYNPETKTYDYTPKEMTKNEFVNTNYEYAIGGFYHEGATAPALFNLSSHYEMIQNSPYVENNPGISQYELYMLRPLGLYKR